QLRLDQLYIVGPEVNIDQRSNKAWVDGSGGMVVRSNTDFQNRRLDHPVPLEILWDKSMFFDGRTAYFHGDPNKGGVQAKQENARLACLAMQVTFDRPVSLREGARGEPQPKVQQLICERTVRVEDKTLEGQRLVRYQRVTGTEVTVEALEEDEAPRPGQGGAGNKMFTTGPGDVRLLQYGSSDPAGPPAPAAPRPGAAPTKPQA